MTIPHRVTGSGSPVVLVIAGVHGDEYEGPAAIHDVMNEVAPAKGTVIFVPVANPEAFHAATRRHPADDGDLNRAFPGDPQGSPTQVLAHRLMQEFVLKADWILSLHGWSKEAMVLPYAEFPEGHADAEAAARCLDFDYVHPYRWPAGVMGEAALRHGIPTVECEIGGMGMATREGAARYVEVMRRFLAHLGVLPFEAPGPRASAAIGHSEICATHAGLLRWRRELGDPVRAGDELALIHGLDGEIVERVRADCDGTLALTRTLASVQPGDLIAQLFWTKEERTSKRKP